MVKKSKPVESKSVELIVSFRNKQVGCFYFDSYSVKPKPKIKFKLSGI